MREEKPRPFSDIAERLKWHREVVEHATQEQYAEQLGVKRPNLALWESGTHRLSLDGALLIRKRFGVSLDFLYEGDDDSLPLSLRQAWRNQSS
ncbi:helix-turn-helix transcriptional regulator [Ruegeria arenilitoris]|uniref:helix-turn-helix transcriptional regulator n=1 Tax=Ruegeria arenilitoris TaxID=1173585 RepID=UPI00147E66EE